MKTVKLIEHHLIPERTEKILGQVIQEKPFWKKAKSKLGSE